RGPLVTGVQTCALPIFLADHREGERVAVRLRPGAQILRTWRERASEYESRVAGRGRVQGRRIDMAPVDLLQREREAAVPGAGRQIGRASCRESGGGVVG